MDRQKILMIFGGAFLAATLLTWFLYAKTQAPQKEKMAAVVAVSRDLPAGVRLTKGDLRKVDIAEKDIPKMSLNDAGMALDRVLLYPVNANEPLTSNKLSSLTGIDGLASTIQNGKRALSVQINDISGVAGLIQPRAHVDVLFTRPGSMTEALTSTILEDVVVLSVGRTTEAQSLSSTDSKGGTSSPSPMASPGGNINRAVTLLVTPEQARKLELAKNQGKISLALRNPLDKTNGEEGDDATVSGESLDPLMYARLARARGGKMRNTGPLPNLKDNAAWSKLIGDDDTARPRPPVVVTPPAKPVPPAPRAVIDVYRGDKHVQEIFHD
jgi:pilus assembly protein CpaB